MTFASVNFENTVAYFMKNTPSKEKADNISVTFTSKLLTVNYILVLMRSVISTSILHTVTSRFQIFQWDGKP